MPKVCKMVSHYHIRSKVKDNKQNKGKHLFYLWIWFDFKELKEASDIKYIIIQLNHTITSPRQLGLHFILPLTQGMGLQAVWLLSTVWGVYRQL